jgi:glutamine phosphoribosylpyrophosphate amidotransferase
MCSVIGYSGPGGGAAAYRLNALFQQSKIRGLHAFGFASYFDGQIYCRRFLDFAKAEAELQGTACVERPLKIIIHCRYSTSGDWQNEANNQPIVVDNVALAFNGVIRMSATAEWSKEFGFAAQTENDGEIFIRKVLDGDDWEHWVGSQPFSFAGLMLRDGNLVALRNTRRPLYHIRNGKRHWFGSTQDIFKRAGFKLPKPVTPNQAMYVG